ncbi:hypothetical protein ACN4DW_04925 [Corynebacterium macclintockiae]|uniref:hypothetical protein n=1 Tax=Corynebacterium macclintockiae TaxID=2913501 RepID=UPI0005503A15
MRKFRNAALAVATATTVAISGVSVAAAEDEQGTTPGSQQTQGSAKTGEKPDLAGSLGKIQDKVEWKKGPISGEDVGNWLKGENKDLPLWMKLFVGGGIAAAAASVFGLIVAPAYNFLKYNGFLG